MPDNPLYKKGVIWRARRDIRAFPDNESHENSVSLREPNIAVSIPRGEHVMLVNYYMGKNYEENIIILWNDRTYFVYDVDTAFDFNTDPKGYNSKLARRNPNNV